MVNVLFVGNYLSAKRGTKGVAERIVKRSDEFENIRFKLTSRHENKLLRLVDMLLSILFRRANIVIIDVYSGQAFTFARLSVMASSIKKKKIVLNLRGGALENFYIAHKNVVDNVLRNADQIITPSAYLQEVFTSNDYRVTYLPNFIDLKTFPYSRAAVVPNSVLWVRSFAAIYQPQLAIKAFAEIRRRIPSATFTMVGPGGTELSACIKLISEMGLTDAVTLTGKINNEILLSYYHSHAVYLNSTLYESFGMAVLEAASCGTPIVSTKVGEIPYLWKDDYHMLLVEPHDFAGMARQAISILENSSLAKKLSTNAFNKAQDFDWEKIKRHWQDLILNIPIN